MDRHGEQQLDIMDAILYVDRTGVQWRYLPHDFPHWNTVYGYFAKWADEGVFSQLNGRASPGHQPDSAERVPVARLARLTVACRGGRHRSVAVAEEVAYQVWAAWGGERGVEVEHRRIDHPVLSPSA